jgi:3',5'-cyclic AMP phosphodiesterase CpdA
MFRLAHVTDPHFRSFAGARPGDFAGKRAVGALNLIVNRGRKHKGALLESLREDLRAQATDHLAVTGDLSNVALESEWREALRWLAAIGAPPDRVTVIPGNHDAYVPAVMASRAFERLFGPYQRDGDPEGGPKPPRDGPERAEPPLPRRDPTPPGGGEPYPFVRVRAGVAMVGVSSAVPTGDLGAWGEVGAAQLARLEAALASAALAGKMRVVLIHHPPVMLKGTEARNLRDRAALAAVLARAGAELVIHGHDHRDERATLPGPGGARIPVVGAGSASYAGGPDRRARYNIYELHEDKRIICITRAHDEGTDAFREVRRETLS